MPSALMPSAFTLIIIIMIIIIIIIIIIINYIYGAYL